MIIIISVIKSLSIIVPALNEEESIPNLLMDISQVFENIDCLYEVIIMMTTVQISSVILFQKWKI